MEFPDLVKMAQGAAAAITPTLGPGDDWEPMLCLISSRGKKQTLVPLGTLMTSETAKDLLTTVIIPMAIEQAEADAFFMVLSSWMIQFDAPPPRDKDGYIDALPPSQHPDRVETLIVQIADQHHHAVVSARIIRDEQEVPSLGEWSDWNEIGIAGLGGRFFDAPMKALRRLHEKNN